MFKWNELPYCSRGFKYLAWIMYMFSICQVDLTHEKIWAFFSFGYGSLLFSAEEGGGVGICQFVSPRPFFGLHFIFATTREQCKCDSHRLRVMIRLLPWTCNETVNDGFGCSVCLGWSLPSSSSAWSADGVGKVMVLSRCTMQGWKNQILNLLNMTSLLCFGKPVAHKGAMPKIVFDFWN